MHVKLLPAFGGPGFENDFHFQNALRAKVSQIQELLMGKRFTYADIEAGQKFHR